MTNVKILLCAAALVFAISLPAFADHEEESWLFNRQGMFNAAHGQTESAIKDFERACQLNPFNDTALTNLACARNNLGVQLAQQKNYDEAIRHFTAAKSQKPEDISIRLNLLSTLVTLKNGTAVEIEARQLLKLRPLDVDLALKVAAALQKTENPQGAQAVLQEMADRAPDSAIIHAALGRQLYRCGNLTDSSFHLQRSIELNPDDEDLKKTLAKLELETSVAKNSNTFTSIHFNLTCHESFSEDWAESLLSLLEDAYSEVGDRLGFYPGQRSQVLVMQTDDFRRVHDLPDWAGGLYDGKIRLPVPGANTRPSSLKGAVMHEYAHHVIYLRSSGKCPIWLNEGLAQIFENDPENLSRFCNPRSQPKAVYTLDELDHFFKNSPDRQQASALYQQSLTATARLVNEHGWQRVGDFLGLLAVGHGMTKATSEAFASDLAEVETLCIGSYN